MKLFTKIGVILAAAVLIGTWLVAPTTAGSGRDCDDNAVIKCGALSTTELANRINGGGSGPHQSSAELKALYGHYGISTSDFGQLKTGWVQKDGEVWVNHKRVFTGAKSMGRHYIPGSTKVGFVNYPLYIRPTSVSFNSNSLESFVYLNPDGSMAYAVIKSCGNIVPGVGKRQPQKIRGFALKFNDLDADGVWDKNEPRMSGVRFRLSGNGQSRSNTTDSNGYAGFWDLNPGTYTVTEEVPAGWRSTTGATKTLVLNADRAFVTFGNARIQQPSQVAINVVKYNDKDGDKTQDDGEELLSGWEFKVTGPNGFNRTVATDASGHSRITGLEPGIYTVTEINKAGWINTTGLTLQRNVTTDPATQTFVFGNRQEVPTEITPGGGETLPTSGPADAAAMAFASLTLSGGGLAYIRSKKLLSAALIK